MCTGLENIYYLTTQKQYTLTIDILSWNGFFYSAQYTQFGVASESYLYQLTIGGYSGNTSDGFTDHNGSKWSTYDKDNYGGHACTSFYPGSWWYSSSGSFCYRINLNNNYWTNGVCAINPTDRCITLVKLQSSGLPIKSVTMKIKPVFRN